DRISHRLSTEFASAAKPVDLSLMWGALTADVVMDLMFARPKGFADARATLVRAPGARSSRLLVEVTPGKPVAVQPEIFQMTTSDLRGRLLVDAQFEPVPEPTADSELPLPDAPGTEPEAKSVEWNTSVRALPLVGSWGEGVPVALVGELSASDTGKRLRLFGAGIDASNRRLLGSLSAAIAEQRGAGGSAKIDLNALTLDGRVDFQADLGLGPENTEALKPGTRGSFDLYLRGADLLSAEGFELAGLKGRVRFDLDRGELQGERLVAELGRTPVELLDAVISRDTEGGFALEAKLEAQSLPLDREHLSLFLDEETLAALIDELEGRGRIDVHGGRLSVKSLSGGTNRVTFSGPITLSDLFVRLGVPLSIQSAEGRIDELVFEGGRVRGYGRLRDLYGRFADRELDRADVLITYVQPRFSIEELSGSFIDEEGQVFPLGGTPPGEDPRPGDRPGSAFSMDLEPPFPFQVAIGLRNVDVAGFTKGLFSSNVANEGRMDGELRLAGNLEELLEIRGSGYARLFDGRLWSVPVVRSVFTLLALDDTAVFDQMSTKFEIQDGVIQMTEVRARSPILRLVGSGSLDLDGSLRHDLEVNYSLIDNLGPITQLLYAIQNSLLRISIRGDMSRPKVSLRGILSGLFGFDSDGRELPLPPFTPLPKRF
ncbi:MAG: AsmA-like C-terminal region-containing protein, partial [Planctomycetota bacterium]